MLESLCLVLPDLEVLILDPVGAVLASSQELRVMDASLDLQQTGLLELASLDDRDRFLFKHSSSARSTEQACKEATAAASVLRSPRPVITTC